MIKDGDTVIVLLKVDEETLGRLKAFRDSQKERMTIGQIVNMFIGEKLQEWDHVNRMFDEYDDDRSEKDCMWEEEE